MPSLKLGNSIDCTCSVLRKGVDVGDHPPITPMRPATEAELGHDAWRLYDFITRHFIGTVSSTLLVCVCVYIHVPVYVCDYIDF